MVVLAPAFRVYLITDGAPGVARSALEAALRGVAAGSVGVQLRCKTITGKQLRARAAELRELTTLWRAPLVINDRVDVALSVGADGVHLPSRGLPVAAARRIAPSLMIGVSTHTLDEAEHAAADGAHFVVFGPVWATPSKAGLGLPVGVPSLAAAARALTIPVFAIGGVTVERAAECVASGARVACIRAIVDAADPAGAAQKLCRATDVAGLT